jgi:hypothetical protein
MVSCAAAIEAGLVTIAKGRLLMTADLRGLRKERDDSERRRLFLLLHCDSKSIDVSHTCPSASYSMRALCPSCNCSFAVLMYVVRVSAALPQLLYVGTALTWFCMSRFPASGIGREKLNGTCILPSTDQDTWEERTPVATGRDVFPKKEDTSHVVEPVSCPLPLY